MRVTITDRVKVWEINDKDGVAEVKFSTSRKVKEDSSYDQVQVNNGVAKNGYIADYRSFVRFIGHAYHQLKNIKPGDTITNVVADMSTEPYWDTNNGCIAYPKNEKITVFEFELYDPNAQTQTNPTRNLDKAPQVAEEPKVAPATSVAQAAPVAPVTPVQPVTPVVEAAPVAAPTAADECPF